MFSAETLVLQLGYALFAVAAVIARGTPRLFIALAAALLLVDALGWSHSTVTQIWMGLALLGCLFVVLRDVIAARAVRFNAEEEAMLSGFLAGMPRHVARHFIDSGVWRPQVRAAP